PAGSDERPVTEAPAPAPAPAAAPAPEPVAARPAAVAPPPAATGDADARMTPAVRRLLREHDLSPAQIAGTGGGGRITREDVLKVVEAIRTGTAISAAPARATPGTASGSAPAPSAPAPAPSRGGLPSPATIAFPEGA